NGLPIIRASKRSESEFRRGRLPTPVVRMRRRLSSVTAMFLPCKCCWRGADNAAFQLVFKTRYDLRPLRFPTASGGEIYLGNLLCGLRQCRDGREQRLDVVLGNAAGDEDDAAIAIGIGPDFELDRRVGEMLHILHHDRPAAALDTEDAFDAQQV